MFSRACRRRRRALIFAAICSLGVGFLPRVAQGQSGIASRSSGEDLERVRSAERESLERTVGRYVSGEAAVYTGELRITERRRGPGARKLPRGRVVASLVQEVGPRGRSQLVLTLVAPDRDLWLRLSQSEIAPEVTRSTLLRPTGAGGGVTASCTGCLGDLAERPAALAFRGFEATGRLGDLHRTTFRVEISGRLSRIDPSRLTLADLEALSPDLQAVVRGEGVRRVERELRELAPTPPRAPSQTRCERVTRYSAERFVDVDDPGRFGVRDVEIVGTRICCFDHDSHGGGERCTAEEAP